MRNSEYECRPDATVAEQGRQPEGERQGGAGG